MPMTGAPEWTRSTEQHTVDDGAGEVGWLETNSAGVDEEAMNSTQAMRKANELFDKLFEFPKELLNYPEFTALDAAALSSSPLSSALSSPEAHHHDAHHSPLDPSHPTAFHSSLFPSGTTIMEPTTTSTTPALPTIYYPHHQGFTTPPAMTSSPYDYSSQIYHHVTTSPTSLPIVGLFPIAYPEGEHDYDRLPTNSQHAALQNQPQSQSSSWLHYSHDDTTQQQQQSTTSLFLPTRVINSPPIEHHQQQVDSAVVSPATTGDENIAHDDFPAWMICPDDDYMNHMNCVRTVEPPALPYSDNCHQTPNDVHDPKIGQTRRPVIMSRVLSGTVGGGRGSWVVGRLLPLAGGILQQIRADHNNGVHKTTRRAATDLPPTTPRQRAPRRHKKPPHAALLKTICTYAQKKNSKSSPATSDAP